MLDTLIVNAEVHDGNGGPAVFECVGIENDKITYIGFYQNNLHAEETIDARGLLLSPGFIDTHAITGFGYFFENAADHKLFQGITTEIIGNCGSSPAPIGEHLLADMEKTAEQIGFSFNWRSLAEYFEKVEKFGSPINIGSYIGHNTLRKGFLTDYHDVNQREMNQIESAVDQAMLEGAFGLSSGLIYTPGCFADTGELIKLTKIVTRHGGIYATHIRDERERLKPALEEALEIGRSAEIPVLISHLKSAERPNWGKIPGILEWLESYHHDNHHLVSFEVYPYTSVSTKLKAHIPPESKKQFPSTLKDSRVRNIAAGWFEKRQVNFSKMMVISDSIAEMKGMTISDISEGWGKSASDTVFDLLVKDPELWIIYDCISEPDMEAAILYRDSIICTDSWSYPVNAPNPIGTPHPRSFGAFTRFLQRYVFESNKLPYAEAIRKITSLPAKFLKIKQRGEVEKGFFADLVLIDPIQLKENATYKNPRQLSSGVQYLWVNGKKVIDKGVKLNVKNGKIIKGSGNA